MLKNNDNLREMILTRDKKWTHMCHSNHQLRLSGAFQPRILYLLTYFGPTLNDFVGWWHVLLWSPLHQTPSRVEVVIGLAYVTHSSHLSWRIFTASSADLPYLLSELFYHTRRPLWSNISSVEMYSTLESHTS